MLSSRRDLLLSSFAVAPAILLRFQDPAAQDAARSRRRPEVPDDSSNDPNAPKPPNSSSKALLEERQKNIKKDVDKLYSLATQLKAEVDKTDSTSVLSLAMLKKAEEIEKLARQIKDRARG
jgi:hypothetical protein